ncbi:MAG: hypothetical protein QXL94_04990, partial [Candidatus Parvarchaeum sp.]
DYNLKIGVKLSKKTGIKFAAYCQVPFGLHALGAASNGKRNLIKLVYSFIKMVPFRLIVMQYIKNLKKADLIIANSHTMRILLNFVYGIHNSEMIYPPLDDAKFIPNSRIRKDSILVFIGRSDDLNDYDSLDIIEDVSKLHDINTFIFGSARVPESKLRGWRNCNVIRNLTDQELNALYNRSYVTICIQKQEFFGYVPIESILCGTPSITLYQHDVSNFDQFFRQYIIDTNLSGLKQELTKVIETESNGNLSINRDIILSKFSLSNSKLELLRKLNELK